jgi:hypothetical protein
MPWTPTTYSGASALNAKEAMSINAMAKVRYKFFMT